MAGYTGISLYIFEKRVAEIAEYVRKNRLDGAFIFSDEYRAGFTTYFSDYKPINVIEESPQGIFITPEGHVTLFLGAINAQSAAKVSWIKDIRNFSTLSGYFKTLKEKKRIVIKVGTSSLTHPETGNMDLIKMEKLVRELTDLQNQGKEVILVSSGAIAVGRKAIGMKERPTELAVKQACASIGQARLMMIYQKLFMEYNQTASQILMTKNTLVNEGNRENARNTFEMLLSMGAIPIVNENDTVSTYEIQFGDNDTLSAIVSALVQADLLILLSDIDGLFTDDPNRNPDARFIEYVDRVDERFQRMAKGSASDVGTGGMSTKLGAAGLATSAGADMIIAHGADMGIIHRIMDAERIGTMFRANRIENFYLIDYLDVPSSGQQS